MLKALDFILSAFLSLGIVALIFINAFDLYQRPIQEHKLDAVFYTADWCGSCPEVRKMLEKDYHLEIVNVSTDEGNKRAIDDNIRKVPYTRFLD